MAIETGDLIPRSSGSASLGVEQIGLDGFSTDIRPFAHVHMNSGIFHDPLMGLSGVIRFTKDDGHFFPELLIFPGEGFEFSVDGGRTYLLGIHKDIINGWNIIHGENANRTAILSSGISLLSVAGTIDLSTYGGGISLGTNLQDGAITLNSQLDQISLLTGMPVGVALNKGISLSTTVTNIALEAGVVGAGMGDIQLSAWGSSGQFRYRFGPHQSWWMKTSHSNTSGPNGDGYWPIAHSGNVAQMIAQAGGATQSLQAAYDGGNEIIIDPHGNYFDGAIVREPVTPELFNGVFTSLLEGNAVSNGIAVSGGLLPLFLSVNGSYRHSSLSALNSQFLYIRSSGAITQNSKVMVFGYVQNHFGSQTGVILSSGSLQTRTYTGDITNIANGTISLKPFDGSGQLEYRMGPHQAWHWKPTYGGTGGPAGDGFQPIPHSGQINQMILAASAAAGNLQSSYEAGRTINTSALNGGPVAISGIDTYGLQLAQLEGSHPHIIISGIYAQATSASVLLPGAMWLQAHSAGIDAQLGPNTVTNQDEASAQSLGIPTLFYNTNGSGITSVRVASGIAQAFNNGNSSAIDEVGIMVPISIITTPTTFYTVDSVSGIGILVPGLYKISYVAGLEKTLGSLTQCVATEIRNQDKWGRVFRMLGSNSTATMRDDNALDRATANGQWLGDLKAGDHIIIFANTTEAPPAGNSVRAKSRQCNLIIEWIGPKCGGESTLQKVS